MNKTPTITQKSAPSSQVAAPVQQPAATSAKPVTIRVRSKDGTFRFDVQPTDKILKIKQLYEEKTNVPAAKLVLAKEKTPKAPLDENKTIAASGLQHGELLTGSYSTDIVSLQTQEEEKKKKYKGEQDIENLQLGKSKKHWTVNEFLDYQNKFKMTIRHQRYSPVSMASVDNNAANIFQSFLRETAFQVTRMGYLLGTTKPGKQPPEPKDEEKPDPNENKELPKQFVEVLGNVIYEPPQESTDTTVKEKVDTKLDDLVDNLAGNLGMKRVGWVISHAGNRDYILSASEVLKAAELQAKYGPNFVTIVVSLSAENQQTVFEAFQVSQQCVELYQKKYFEIDPKNPAILKCTKKVEVQKKLADEVETVLLVSNVAIGSTASVFQMGFPIRNRPAELYAPKQSIPKVKEILQARERKGQKLVQRLSDFHLLLYLMEASIFVKSDIPVIGEAVQTQQNTGIQTYELILQAYCK